MYSFIFVALISLTTTAYAKRLVEAQVTLTPAGSFVAANNMIKGHVERNGTKLYGKNIKVNMRQFKTGFEIRDTHLQGYIKADKHPFAEINNAIGEDGKGSGEIEFMGQKKKINFTYVTEGEDYIGTFVLNISEWGITSVQYKGIGVGDTVKVIVTLPLKSQE